MKKDKIGENYALKWAKKIKGINLLGRKCKKCGQDNIFVLEFHHLFGKDNAISKMRMEGVKWSLLEKEIKKCILLCANCHSELHYKESRGSILKDDILFDMKIDPKCKKCGYRGNNLKSLCFRHRNKKLFDVSNAMARKINGCSVQDIIDEIKKCDILCRNCHIIEHMSKKKFKKIESVIYNKVKNHKELNRLDYKTIRIMKQDGHSITEIARKMGKGKSSIFYAFHRV